ncbi:MBL fold metallo-hydrolase [Candidatus Bathyarchaeota archaeon]|nr:MBL fold metallo-hydrolase [Candidatus Bathyarchaeota archaeon]
MLIYSSNPYAFRSPLLSGEDRRFNWEGRVASREVLRSMELELEQLNPKACKTYMFGNEGRRVVIVDPVLDEVDTYMHLLEDRKLDLEAILETHTHADHISGAAALQDRTGAELFMHENAPATCLGSENRFGDGDILELAGVDVEVIYTPGHTRDSVSFLLPGMLLSGDALFLDEGGAGRDDLPGGDAGAHYETLNKFLKLDDSLVVYPAHDYRERLPSSLAIQKDSNPHLKKAMGSKEEFIDYITNLKLGPADWMKDVLKANYACALEPGDVWIPADQSSCEVKGTLNLGTNEQIVESMTVRELKARMELNDEMLLLDVREPFEINGALGKIDGIKNIPITQLTSKLNDLMHFKDKPVVSICKIGGRSFTAGQILKQEGFKQVYYLEGGMIAWNNAHAS